jgi:hypothetical protein
MMPLICDIGFEVGVGVAVVVGLGEPIVVVDFEHVDTGRRGLRAGEIRRQRLNGVESRIVEGVDRRLILLAVRPFHRRRRAHQRLRGARQILHPRHHAQVLRECVVVDTAGVSQIIRGRI